MTRIDGQLIGVRQDAGLRRCNDLNRGCYDYTRRSDYLGEDTVQLSGKEGKKEKGVIGTTCDTIVKGAKSFVNLTVNAFAKAASEVVVDKAVGKMAGK